MSTRANIHLDNDAYAFASAYAKGKGIPLGAAVSELLRRAERAPEPPSGDARRFKKGPNGLLILAKNGRRPITPEMVKEGSEDDFA